MPKSASTLQNQITACERKMKVALAQCAVQAGDKDFKFNFSLNVFVSTITTFDLNQTGDSITKVMGVFAECEKIVDLEKIKKEKRIYGRVR